MVGGPGWLRRRARQDGQVLVLVTVTGRDRPGVTAAVAQALERAGAYLLDVEQVVVAGRLVLSVLVRVAELAELHQQLAVSSAGPVAGLEVSAEVTDERSVAANLPWGRAAVRHHVTLLGDHVRPAALASVAAAIAGAGANIERIHQLANFPVSAVELVVAGGESGPLRGAVTLAAAGHGVDVAVERAGLHRRAKRLILLDVDSTLVQGEVIEMLAERAGCARRVAEVTASAMAGELDFEASLRARVALLAGLPASALGEVAASLQLARGARTLVRTAQRLGYLVGAVSGGFSQVVEPLARTLGLDRAVANTLEIRDGLLTGGLVGPVVDRAGKARVLVEFAAAAGVPLAQTVAIGDGANDIEMLAQAGLGVAYNAKAVLTEVADAAVNVPYLDAVLFLLGLTREEIETAAADDGD